MRGVAALIACTGCLVGCEVLVGITGKTLVDASTGSDGGAGSDSSVGPGADGSVGDAADASVPCILQPQPYIFCQDFDHEDDAGASWTYVQFLDGGTVQLDPTTYKTPPQSAMVFMPGDHAEAQLGLQLQPQQQPSSSFSLGFDLYVGMDDLTTIPQVGIAQVYRSAALGTPSFNYILGPGSTCDVQIYPQSGPAADVNLPLPRLNAWTRITLVYDMTTGLSVVEDGTVIGSSTAVTGPPPDPMGVIVGGVYSNPAAGAVPLVVEIDDVVLRGQ